MIKNVKNNANPIKTWFGGAVCVPIAVLTKCKTIIILVYDVSIIKIDGAKVKIVSNNKIRIGADIVPSSLSVSTVIWIPSIPSFLEFVSFPSISAAYTTAGSLNEYAIVNIHTHIANTKDATQYAFFHLFIYYLFLGHFFF